MNASLHIALVTPFSWSIPNAVNLHVASLALELRARGHRPVVVASSDDPSDTERVRPLFRVSSGKVVELLADYRGGKDPDSLLLPSAGVGPLSRSCGVPVIPLGSSFPVRLYGGVTNLGMPIDVTSRIGRLAMGGGFDLVHVHEPVAPSLSFTALREARSPVVATFHLTPVGVAGYGMGQSVLDRFFQRLDARIATFTQGAELLTELYPGDYQVIPCGTRLAGDVCDDEAVGGPCGQDESAGRLMDAGRYGLYVYRGDARRSYRAFLKALLEGFPEGLDKVVVAMHRESALRWVPRGTPRKLRDRVMVCEFGTSAELKGLYQSAAVVILPYLGGEWLPVAAAEAAVLRRPVVGPDLAPIRDLLSQLSADEVADAVFSPNTLGSLRRSIDAVLTRFNGGSWPVPAKDLAMPAVVDRIESVYKQTLAATSEREGLADSKTPMAGKSLHLRGIGDLSPRRRTRAILRESPRADWINADLHIHSNFSKDCVSTIESILATAREVGLGAVAIADHDEIDGALLAKRLSDGDPFVIVAEEVKTREGEVIGLFLQERIPGGLSFDETLSLIKEQGGLVYVPHPFDALRTTPSYRAMVDNLHRIDVVEIYNAKVALSSFNLAAERFASKYNVVAGAGSDSHVLQGLGTAMLHMPRFDDQVSFMAALSEADIVARRKNLLYLQSIKFLQTTLDRALTEE